MRAFNLALEEFAMPENNSLSRRRFAQLLGVGAAIVATRPSIVLPAVASKRTIGSPASATIVRLSSNENPYGPSPMAAKAMANAFDLAWRYPDEHAEILIDMLAKHNGVKTEQILLGDGSGEILKLCASAFTGSMTNDRQPIELARPTRGPALTFVPGRGRLIVADPTFEAILNHARISRAEVVKVPLTKTYAHDLKRMSTVAREGLIYICNPNNPTASITLKRDLRECITKTPKSTMILVDEAYHHYADSADYESVIPMVKDHPNLIVARTFSKIYGMAGLRLGYCVAQPETIKRMRPHQTWDSVNLMALSAAIASLNDPEQVPNGHRLNAETKQFVIDEIGRLGYTNIPSQANFVMIDVRRPVQPLIKALRDRSVQVGRLFPALPTHMRVTIGKQSEMQTFMAAFREVVRA
jgi:histidinol-phosphate aminotransferase